MPVVLVSNKTYISRNITWLTSTQTSPFSWSEHTVSTLSAFLVMDTVRIELPASLPPLNTNPILLPVDYCIRVSTHLFSTSQYPMSSGNGRYVRGTASSLPADLWRVSRRPHGERDFDETSRPPPVQHIIITPRDQCKKPLRFIT